MVDVREGVEALGDQLRWVPTDHMLVDSLTQGMNPSLLMKYLHEYTYTLKYDMEIAETKSFSLQTIKIRSNFTNFTSYLLKQNLHLITGLLKKKPQTTTTNEIKTNISQNQPKKNTCTTSKSFTVVIYDH